ARDRGPAGSGRLQLGPVRTGRGGRQERTGGPGNGRAGTPRPEGPCKRHRLGSRRRGTLAGSARSGRGGRGALSRRDRSARPDTCTGRVGTSPSASRRVAAACQTTGERT